MPYTYPAFEENRDKFLRDIRAQLPEADTGSDSDNYVRASSVSAAVEGLYQKAGWVFRQIWPDTADPDEMLRWAATRGVIRKAAVNATSSAALTGQAGVEVVGGAALIHIASGQRFLAAETVLIEADGTAIVPVTAETSGSALNGLSGPATVVSPPLGLDARAELVEPSHGGEDQEAIASVLARLLDIMQQPPAGGADYDYGRWAKEVPGVAGAIVLPKRRGAGTVDVVITGTDGLPSDEVVQACQTYIENQCSVIADVWVFAPLVIEVDCVAEVELEAGYTLEDIQPAADDAYAKLVGALKPQETLKYSQIEAMVSNLAGVIDREVIEPSGNVVATKEPRAVGWIRPGKIELRVMQ